MKVVEGKFLLVENLDGEENCADLKSRAPLVLEDVQADPTQLVNVWVVDPGDEPHLHKVMLHTFANCRRKICAHYLKQFL